MPSPISIAAHAQVIGDDTSRDGNGRSYLHFVASGFHRQRRGRKIFRHRNICRARPGDGTMPRQAYDEAPMPLKGGAK